MDDELRRWAATWKQMEAFDMAIVRRAQSAYRTEAVRQLLEVMGLGVGVVLVATKTASMFGRGDISVADGLRIGIVWSALVVGGAFIRRSARQRAKSQTLLADTPQSLVSDLVRVHERELQLWVGKWALGAAGFLGVAALALGAIAAAQGMAASQRFGVVWGPLGFVVAALGALAMFGHRRASFLRRELQGLYGLQRELDANERSAVR